ncbi:hypothetical protein AA11825_1385 [Acetobacter pomorum DSM 11825]|nr:hypothetical protein AA11825_1385 [Acetobacter pomorum DSM 11825]
MQAPLADLVLKIGFPNFHAARMGLGLHIGWIQIHQAAWPLRYASNPYWPCNRHLQPKQHKKPIGPLSEPDPKLIPAA